MLEIQDQDVHPIDVYPGISTDNPDRLALLQ